MCKTICVQCPLLDLTVAELVSSYPAAPPPKSSSSWSTGSAPTSRKAQNKLLAGLLPDHNNGISRSLYKFSKTMLGMTHKDDDYPLEPSEGEHRLLLQDLTKETIINDQSVFTSTEAIALMNNANNMDWIPFKDILLVDLQHYKIPRFTFDWLAALKEQSQWNKIMILFLVKHYIFAKKAGAFFNYTIELKWDQEIVYIGLTTRWLRGQIEQIKTHYKAPEKAIQRLRSRKKREVSDNPAWLAY